MHAHCLSEPFTPKSLEACCALISESRENPYAQILIGIGISATFGVGILFACLSASDFVGRYGTLSQVLFR